jgi:hypothetical protein
VETAHNLVLKTITIVKNERNRIEQEMKHNTTLYSEMPAEAFSNMVSIITSNIAKLKRIETMLDDIRSLLAS